MSVALDPSAYFVYIQLGNLYLRQGRRDMALQAYEDAALSSSKRPSTGGSAVGMVSLYGVVKNYLRRETRSTDRTAESSDGVIRLPFLAHFFAWSEAPRMTI
jgi:hypothetical protein